MIEKLKEVFYSKVFSNMKWLVGERIFQMVIALVINMVTARYLGVDNYGIINYVASFIAFFTPICSLGLEGIIIKELVDNPDKQGEVIGTAMGMRVGSSLLSMIAILLLLTFLNPGDTVMLGVAVFQSLILIFNTADLFEFWYQSRLESRKSVKMKIISYFLVAIYKILILVFHKSIYWFALTNTLDMMVAYALLFLSYRRDNGSQLTFSLKKGKDMLKISYNFIISGLMVAVYAQMDKIMLGKMLDTTAVGLYSVGIYICNLWNFIPNAIIVSLRPGILQAKQYNEELYIKKLKQMYAIIIWISILYAVAVCIFSKYIIWILYGKDFLGAREPLMIAVWYCGFSLIGSARDVWIISEKLQKYSKYFALVGALTNLILNFVLIPLWGMVGAASATLITQIMTGFVVTLPMKKTRNNNRYLIEALLLRGIR